MFRMFYSLWYYFIENKAVGVMKPGHTFTIEPMISQGTCYIIVGLLKHFWVIIGIRHESWYLKYWFTVTPLSFLLWMFVLVCLFFSIENLFICLFLCSFLGLFVCFSNKLIQLGRKVFKQTLLCELFILTPLKGVINEAHLVWYSGFQLNQFYGLIA